jgi:hypothetical protein
MVIGVESDAQKLRKESAFKKVQLRGGIRRDA